MSLKPLSDRPGGPTEPPSRRTFLTGVAAGAALIGAGPALSACGSSPRTTAASAAVGAPKRGGTLIAGFTGGTSTDTLNAEANVNNVDAARNCQLYEPLTRYNAAAQVELILAEALEPNSNATEWTIRVRPDVTFHNGKKFGAEDVLFSLQYITNPKTPYQGASMLSALNLADAKVLDPLTLRVPCFKPYSILPDVLADTITSIIPVGYDPQNPVGTGPFRYKSFTPGSSSTFVRFENYWQAPLPYLDEVIINDFADETSQVNGLLAGDVDVVNSLSAPSIPAIENSGNSIIISKSGGWTPFTMRVDVAPFNDVRVRQAFRLMVDRPKMLEAVFAGYGTPGNDLFAIWDPCYDHSIPQREQDIEQAKFLLKQAGQEGLNVALNTASIAQGTVQAAEVLAQQASAAGVTVHLNTLTSTAFFGPNYLKWTFAQDVWYYFGYLSQVTQATLPNAFYNECHFNNERYVSLYNECCAIPNPADRVDLEHEMQEIDWTENGYIIPYFPPVIDGYSKRVHGATGGKNGSSFNSYDFKNMWLD